MGFKGKLKDLINHKFNRVHYTPPDLYFLEVTDSFQKDNILLVNTLYNLGFSRSKYSSREQFVYTYEKLIKSWPWRLKPSYKLRACVFKTVRGLYVPVITVKDLYTLKEFDPLIVPWHDRKVVQNAIDDVVQMMLDSGLVVIANNFKILKTY